jgi:hypothetical protein
MAPGKEVNLEAGRAYVELRRLFRYGKLSFVKCEAALFGVAYRTIKNYMRVARENDKP